MRYYILVFLEDKYTGPNAHLIAVDEANDSVVFPKVKGLLHTK